MWHWNTYVEERGLLQHNKNNSENKIKGAIDKSLGSVKGRADMTFFYEGRVIFIEIKVGNDYQKKDQKDFESLVLKHGFKYKLIGTFDDFKKCIQDFKDNL